MIITTLLPRIMRRSGVRLYLAFFSLILGALTLAAVLGLIGSVQRFFISESRTLLGGDVTIESNTAVDSAQPALNLLRERGATLSWRTDTLVVVQSSKPQITTALSSLLVTVKVVDAQYPLYGALGLRETGPSVPNENEVFIAEDMLVRMNLAIGEKLTIGSEQFLIQNVVTSEPDRIGGSFRLGPLLIISQAGWARTGLDGKQSRADYMLSIRYPDTFTASDGTLATQDLKREFERPKYRISVAADGPTSLLRILDSAERFFFSMIVLALFLVVVNIRLNLTYFIAAFQKTIAIIRSLGMPRGQLLLLFVSLLSTLAVVASAVGAMLGNLLANAALPYAEKFVGSALPSVALYENVFVVTLFTFLLCLFSALGFLTRVLAIEPKMLLHGYGSEHGGFVLLAKELPMLLFTLAGFYAVVYYLTETAHVALIAVGSITGVFVVLFLISRGVILFGHRVRFSLSFPQRCIMNFLKHQGLIGTTAIASLTVALASVFAIALLEKNMLGNLNIEFKADAPNIYLIDVQQDQLEGVKSIMGTTWKEFSTARARFTTRDGYNIQENLSTEDEEMRREFNITSSAVLIDGEKLIAGVWHGAEHTKEVSVEKSFAERAKLKLGSIVEFTISGYTIEAKVTSIREVIATNGLPFFYLVFSPDLLEQIPRTSFGYAYVPSDKIPVLQNTLAITYPNITSIPTTQIIDAARKIVAALSAAVVATAIPALFLGLMLIIAMLAISARERANDMLVFTAHGARMRLLFKLFLIESSAVVVISGLFAVLISHIGIYALNYYVFDFTGFYFAGENIYLFLVVLAFTLLTAFFFARRFTTLSPAALLRKDGM